MNINNEAPYVVEQGYTGYGDANRSIPVTAAISDAPDLTMPAGIYDDAS